jgi:hypothetical protein
MKVPRKLRCYSGVGIGLAAFARPMEAEMFAPTQRDLISVPLRAAINSSTRRTWSPGAVHGLPKQTHL